MTASKIPAIAPGGSFPGEFCKVLEFPGSGAIPEGTGTIVGDGLLGEGMGPLILGEEILPEGEGPIVTLGAGLLDGPTITGAGLPLTGETGSTAPGVGIVAEGEGEGIEEAEGEAEGLEEGEAAAGLGNGEGFRVMLHAEVSPFKVISCVFVKVRDLHLSR